MFKWGTGRRGENSHFRQDLQDLDSDYWILDSEFCLFDRIYRIIQDLQDWECGLLNGSPSLTESTEVHGGIRVSSVWAL